MRERAARDLLDDAEAVALFREYRATGNPVLHARICATYAPLVDRIARMYRSSGEPLEDLVQVGYVGLLLAVNRFDPDRGVKFQTYASHLIAGEIRHYLRDQVGVVRRPRWLARLSRELDRTVERLQRENGALPTVEEIAQAMNITPEGVREIFQARAAASPLSLDGPGEERIRRIRHLRYESFQLPVEDRITVLQAMERLTELQRKVLYLLFYQDLTETEAARRLRISQRHVSRVMHKALRQMAQLLRGAVRP
ncbi:MAG: sigma-70 family RNA polymerase sigma factor [Armatimonadota bacterium]|nr:sigma-70 family RNA polymerase sigma factor [Armatimonadota bacterium]